MPPLPMSSSTTYSAMVVPAATCDSTCNPASFVSTSAPSSSALDGSWRDARRVDGRRPAVRRYRLARDQPERPETAATAADRALVRVLHVGPPRDRRRQRGDAPVVGRGDNTRRRRSLPPLHTLVRAKALRR